MKINTIITDFDGTFVDTFEANYAAYSSVLAKHGITLTHEEYEKCFGLRFDEFMCAVGIYDEDLKKEIRTEKALEYPNHFDMLVLNNDLVSFLTYMHMQGVKICIASTAAKKNLYAVLEYFVLDKLFDYIVTGEDVKHGKPNPEVYLHIMDVMHSMPNETLIFEDSPVGIDAAARSGASYIKVTMNR